MNRDQLITRDDLENFKTEMLLEIKKLLEKRTGDTAKQWLKSAEVRKLLGVSPGTLQNLRINGTLPFSKIGGIVFYRHDDISRLLNNNSSRINP